MSTMSSRKTSDDDNMTHRFQVRCTPAEFADWQERADKLGIPTVGAFLRFLAKCSTRGA